MKKIISLLLCTIILLASVTNIFADNSNKKYLLDEPIMLNYSIDGDGNVAYEKIVYIRSPKDDKSKLGDIQSVVEYPYGTVRVIESRGTETARYADIDQRYATISPTYYYALTAAGFVITSGAGPFIIGAAGSLGVALDSLIGKTVEISGYVHRDRVYKKAQVYTTSGWKDYYTCVNREWYAHIIIPDNVNPSNDQILHCTYQNGFNPFKKESAPHFNDYTYITNRAQELYYLNQNPIVEYGF